MVTDLALTPSRALSRIRRSVTVKAEKAQIIPHRKKRKHIKKKKPNKAQWFKPRTKSGWKKDMPQRKRRQLVLRAHHGDLLSAARSKQALSNISRDPRTRVEARKDAQYFLAEYHKRNK